MWAQRPPTRHPGTRATHTFVSISGCRLTVPASVHIHGPALDPPSHHWQILSTSLGGSSDAGAPRHLRAKAREILHRPLVALIIFVLLRASTSTDGTMAPLVSRACINQLCLVLCCTVRLMHSWTRAHRHKTSGSLIVDTGPCEHQRSLPKKVGALFLSGGRC